MKSVLHKLLIICCVLYLSGAHWMVLQVTAWTGMLVARSQTAPVAEVVEKTFDGKHPCRLCLAIKNTQEVKFVELEGVALPELLAAGEIRWPDIVGAALARMDAPPTPPPLA